MPGGDFGRWGGVVVACWDITVEQFDAQLVVDRRVSHRVAP